MMFDQMIIVIFFPKGGRMFITFRLAGFSVSSEVRFQNFIIQVELFTVPFNFVSRTDVGDSF